jgi:hypothetical protein
VQCISVSQKKNPPLDLRNHANIRTASKITDTNTISLNFRPKFKLSTNYQTQSQQQLWRSSSLLHHSPPHRSDQRI